MPEENIKRDAIELEKILEKASKLHVFEKMRKAKIK